MIHFCHAKKKKKRILLVQSTNCHESEMEILRRCLSSCRAAVERRRHTACVCVCCASNTTQYSFVHSATSPHSQPHFGSISKLRTAVGHCGRDTSCGFAISADRRRSSHAPLRWRARAPADTLQRAALLFFVVLCWARTGLLSLSACV